jgi:ribonuclease J
MVQYAKECSMFPDYLLDHIVDMSQVSKIAREDLLIFVTGSQAQPNAMLSKLASGDGFRGIQIKSDDTVILSSRHIPGNERAIQNMMNRLSKIGARVLSGHNAFVHVGGHGHKDETKQIYELLKPQYAVPSYGTYTHLKEHQKFVKDHKLAQCLFITNGDKLHLGPEEPSIIERVETGRCYIDGYNILDEDKYILRERRQMSFEGLATVTLGVDFRNKSITFGPTVKTKGIIDEELQSDVMESVVAEVERSLSAKYKNNRINDPLEAEEVMRQAVRRAFGRERGRKPVTIPLVVEVQ